MIDFLEQDTHTRLVAQPQIRGQEGAELELNLGQDIPVPTTAFTPLAVGGASFNPLTSFTYRPVGVILRMTPRVTYENEIVLDLEVENSTLGPPILVAGQSLPTFGTRKVVTRLRLRDGESNLLAGLLSQEERQILKGFPGLLRLPILKQLFSANDESAQSTDIVMLLTPHIVRTHRLTQEDVGADPHRNPEQPGRDRPPAAHRAPAGRGAVGSYRAPSRSGAEPLRVPSRRRRPRRVGDPAVHPSELRLQNRLPAAGAGVRRWFEPTGRCLSSPGASRVVRAIVSCHSAHPLIAADEGCARIGASASCCGRALCYMLTTRIAADVRLLLRPASSRPRGRRRPSARRSTAGEDLHRGET